MDEGLKKDVSIKQTRIELISNPFTIAAGYGSSRVLECVMTSPQPVRILEASAIADARDDGSGITEALKGEWQIFSGTYSAIAAGRDDPSIDFNLSSNANVDTEIQRILWASAPYAEHVLERPFGDLYQNEITLRGLVSEGDLDQNKFTVGMDVLYTVKLNLLLEVKFVTL
jgi:hypothetical protein